MRRMATRSGRATGLRRLGLVAVPLAAGVALTACGQAQPGVAASIDGDTISVVETQERAADFFESYPQAVEAVTADRVTAITVENFLRGKIIDQVGAAYGLEPTATELTEFVDETYGGMEEFTNRVSGIGVAANRPELVQAELRSAWIRNALLERTREELGSADEEAVEAATAEIIDEFTAAADVSVNPRFGTWSGSIMTAPSMSGSGSISIIPTAGPESGAAPAPGG
jgi:hypothetical protein